MKQPIIVVVSIWTAPSIPGSRSNKVRMYLLRNSVQKLKKNQRPRYIMALTLQMPELDSITVVSVMVIFNTLSSVQLSLLVIAIFSLLSKRGKRPGKCFTLDSFSSGGFLLSSKGVEFSFKDILQLQSAAWLFTAAARAGALSLSPTAPHSWRRQPRTDTRAWTRLCSDGGCE